MSVNITVAVPLDAVAAVKQTADPAKMADALSTITKAVVAGVKALPYRVEAGAATKDEDDDEEEEEDRLSIRSFDSDAPASAPPPSKKVKREPVSQGPAPHISVVVQTLTGLKTHVRVHPNASCFDLKMLYQHQTGIPVDQQRLVFEKHQLEDYSTLRDVSELRACSSRDAGSADVDVPVQHPGWLNHHVLPAARGELRATISVLERRCRHGPAASSREGERGGGIRDVSNGGGER